MIESAQEFFNRVWDSTIRLSFDEYKAAMICAIEIRGAAMRKECAYRALEAIGNIAPSKRSDWNLVETSIRAAIEGGKE